MILRITSLFLVLTGIGVADTPPQEYALAPPGHGVNGDWAFFSRFAKDNESLKTDVSRVVFMGDSITEGWARESFIAGDSHYVGRGIGGQTALQMLVRFRADVIDLKPELVHIMAGTNDVAENNGPESDEEIEGALQSMAELALAHHIKVVLASIPPADEFKWHPGLNPVPRIRRLNDWIRSYAKQVGVGYVDYWPALATDSGAMKPSLSGDGVHPSSEGYRAMQPLAEAAIKAALGHK